MNDEEIKKESKEEEFQDVTFVDSTEDGDELPIKDVVKKLRADLKQARAEKEEYLTGWQRAKADYVNLQKEMDQISRNTSILTKERMIENLLPALDSFDMAFANKEAWASVDENWRKGVEYIHQQFITSLSNSGVEKINKVSVSFDPTLHESIEMITTDDQTKDHTIAQVIQSGYKIGDRVIRPARVNVFTFK